MKKMLDYLLRDIEYHLVKLRWKKPQRPIIVYQMGKVASSSVYQSLKSTPGCTPFHVHRLNPENMEKVRLEHKRLGNAQPHEKISLMLYDRLVKNADQPTLIISLVREPIGRNISAFFQNLGTFFKSADAHSAVEMDKLISRFLEKYPHDVPLTWFDDEMKATTGIDVYSKPFPIEEGHVTFNADPFRLLVMRHNLADEVKQQSIRKFLNEESFQLTRHNEASAKTYSDSYKSFIKRVTITDSYAERMLSSRYAQHFYSDQEREELFAKWTQPR